LPSRLGRSAAEAEKLRKTADAVAASDRNFDIGDSQI
jgi:hypothetical protein